MKAHRNAIRSLYSHKNLQAIFNVAANSPRGESGDLEFASFHTKLIEGFFPSIKIDFTTTNTVEYARDDADFSISSTCHKISDKLIADYESYEHIDTLAHAAYLNPGRAIIYTPFFNPQQWDPHPDFLTHCARYAIHSGLTVVFRYPSKLKTFLTVDYMGAPENKSWIKMQYNRLELATFPFALAWFFRKGVLDDSELQRRFLVLQNRTEIQLQNLRKFINSPFESYQQQAEKLGIKTGSYKESLYDLRDRAASQLKWNLDNIGSSQMKMRPMETEYAFLRMLGDHTSDLQKLPADQQYNR